MLWCWVQGWPGHPAAASVSHSPPLKRGQEAELIRRLSITVKKKRQSTQKMRTQLKWQHLWHRKLRTVYHFPPRLTQHKRWGQNRNDSTCGTESYVTVLYQHTFTILSHQFKTQVKTESQFWTQHSQQQRQPSWKRSLHWAHLSIYTSPNYSQQNPESPKQCAQYGLNGGENISEIVNTWAKQNTSYHITGNILSHS